MPILLHIETATKICSVVVSDNNKIIFEQVSTEGPSHASLLGVFVAEAMNYLKEKNKKPDAIAVSCGPGSYTGLRIGVSEAKGLCYGLNIPMIAIKTLEIMAKQVIETCNITDNSLLCPMIDARRMEVYAAIYDKKLNIIREIAADIVDGDSYKEYLSSSEVFFFGDGAHKCKECITDANAKFIENIYPSAQYMVELAEEAFEAKQFVDTAYFEPFYLKDFVATTPKNSILNQRL